MGDYLLEWCHNHPAKKNDPIYHLHTTMLIIIVKSMQDKIFTLLNKRTSSVNEFKIKLRIYRQVSNSFTLEMCLFHKVQVALT